MACLDQKQVSLHDEARSAPGRPGHIAKRDSEYRRCGVTHIFAVVELKTGRHLNRATPNRSGREFALTLRGLARRYRHATKQFAW
ncbi:MAG: transposase [Bryobacteraceae bacterium]